MEYLMTNRKLDIEDEVKIKRKLKKTKLLNTDQVTLIITNIK